MNHETSFDLDINKLCGSLWILSGSLCNLTFYFTELHRESTELHGESFNQ